MFDVHTLALVFGVIALGFVLGLVALARILPSEASVRLWLAGSLSLLVGMGALSFRGRWPDLVTLELANTLIALGVGSFYMATGQMAAGSSPRERPEPPWHWMAAGTMLVGMAVFSRVYPSLSLRLVLMACLLTPFFLGMAWRFWQMDQSSQKLPARITAVLLLGGVLMIAVRAAVGLSHGYGDDHSSVNHGLYALPYFYGIVFLMWMGISISLIISARLQAQLRLALEQSETSSRAKSDFLASMSHELRTPLNAILGFSHLLAADRNAAPHLRAQAHDIEKAGQQLLGLVNQVMDLSRIESGHLHLSLAPASARELMMDGLQWVTPMAQQHGVVLLPLQLDTDVRLRVDYPRMRQVLVNLLSNAIKYNRPLGTVALGLQRVDGHARLTVQDTGLGIAPDKQALLFQPFNRLGNEQGLIGGLGIGLLIARNVVQAMGGRIGFESTPGVGSTFWVEVALDESSEPTVHPSRFDPSTFYEGTPPQEAAPPPPEAASPPATTAPQILYVEDNPVNQRLMKVVLEKQLGAKLHLADTAEAGLQAVEAQRPDLILMDINLPGMNGYEALAALKARPATAAIPVVAVTANAMKGDSERGLDAGFAAYLTKPLHIPTVLDTVQTVLGQRRPDLPLP
jgi:signal transduction histidine kinase/ActR/RegA family two-component response regulator